MVIDSPLRKDLQRLRLDRQSTWEGSEKTLEGLHSDNVDPRGERVNQQSTREGSVKTYRESAKTC